MTPAHGSSGVNPRPRPIKPKAGQESVWDYPRPPRVEPRSERIVVRFGGEVIADTTDAVRVLETSHPPVYYLPMDAFPAGVLVPAEGTSFCEFKGEARYFDVVAGGAVVPHGGWTYPEPARGFEPLSTRVALYPRHMDSCEVDGEQVTSQEGDFYGGWITKRIVDDFLPRRTRRWIPLLLSGPSRVSNLSNGPSADARPGAGHSTPGGSHGGERLRRPGERGGTGKLRPSTR